MSQKLESMGCTDYTNLSMKLNALKFVTAILWIVGCSSVALADFGQAGWMIFRKAQPTRSQAVSATSPQYSDLSGLFSNPATLASEPQKELYFVSESGYVGDVYGALAYRVPAGGASLTVGAMYYDLGTTELNWLENGELKSENVSAQRDFMALLSYGREFSKSFAAGVTLKSASSELVQRKRAYAYCADAAMLYQPSAPLALAVAVQNVGLSTKFDAKESPLPSLGFIGASYTYQAENYSVMPCLGLNYHITDAETVPEAGIEVRYGFLSANAGYRMNADESSLHFGLGFDLGRVNVGYALLPGTYLDSVQRISLGYRFGNSAAVNRETAVRPQAVPAAAAAPARAAQQASVTAAPAAPVKAMPAAAPAKTATPTAKKKAVKTEPMAVPVTQKTWYKK